jgi:hypothetical protein
MAAPLKLFADLKKFKNLNLVGCCHSGSNVSATMVTSSQQGILDGPLLVALILSFAVTLQQDPMKFKRLKNLVGRVHAMLPDVALIYD